MAEPTQGSISPGGASGGQVQQKANQAAQTLSEEAGGIKDQAAQAAGEIKDQATSELTSIKGEATQQAKHLGEQARDQVSSQADSVTRQVATYLSDAGHEFTSMADNSSKPDGPITNAMRQLGERVESTARHIETQGSQGIVNDVNRFARNRPGMFLAACAGVGFLAGRLLRNADTQSLAQAAKDEISGGQPEGGQFAGTQGQGRYAGASAGSTGGYYGDPAGGGYNVGTREDAFAGIGARSSSEPSTYRSGSDDLGPNTYSPTLYEESSGDGGETR